MKKYETLEHPADFKIRVYGRDLSELFQNIAIGMTNFIYGEDVCAKKQWFIRTEKIEIESKDLKSLLVDWLSEILYLGDANDRAYVKYKIKKISENKVIAKIGSCKAEAKEDIKAVTYNELKIEKRDGGWIAEVVFDI